MVRDLAAPVICFLLLALSVPYTICKGVAPLLGESGSWVLCLLGPHRAGTVIAAVNANAAVTSLFNP